MKIITAHNPDHALENGINLLKEFGTFESSRAGEVLVANCPVVTQWVPHRSLASLDPIRDANPFFHLNEAIWMLKGENDARLLDSFVSDFSKRFAESDGTLHGAYGHRWRKHFGFDQLSWIIAKLKEDPSSRQCVLQMWDTYKYPDTDSWRDGDLTGNWKDRPCNTHIYFRTHDNSLDMTICCRSNDMIWGAYGANVVHFGVLHEYVAAEIGMKLGFMYQFSNNFHAYTNVLGPLLLKESVSRDTWWRQQLPVMPMFDQPAFIDSDLENWNNDTVIPEEYNNNLFKVATMANSALEDHRKGLSIKYLSIMFKNYDWVKALDSWLQRRQK